MGIVPEERAEVGARWTSSSAARHYASARWRSPGKEDRDPRTIGALLQRHGHAGGPVLDVPCGTGRLKNALEAVGHAHVGVDVSRSMLLAGPPGDRIQASVFQLPFAADSFPAVVACRLLHHLRDPAQLRSAVRELVRVSSGLVVVTFWDSRTLPGWHRRLRPKPGRGRCEHSRALLRSAFEQAGAQPLEFRATFPWLSRQTYAVARTS